MNEAVKTADVALRTAAEAAWAEATQSLRVLQEAGEALAGAPGFKALLRRFAEVLVRHFHVQTFEAVRLGGRQGRPVVRRRLVRADDAAALSDEELATLGKALSEMGPASTELRDGFTLIAIAGRSFQLALLDDPMSRQGCLVAWEPAAQAALPAPVERLLLEQLVRQLQNESRWLRKLDKTQAMLYRDDLTGLYNSRYLEIALDAELRRAERFQTQFCLLFIDLDGFKEVNDQHGHLSGSSALKQVAEVLREAVREVDAPIRYGGDEFVVVLLGATCAKGVLVAERVRRRIEARELRLEDGATARITASIGVAAYPEHGRDRETLLKMADETMYHSKKAGKNRVTVVGGRPVGPATENKET